MSYYRIGINSSRSWDGISRDMREYVPPAVNNIKNRMSDLKVGIGLWKSADNRFYHLGISPDKITDRDVVGVPVVDKVANLALDWVHIGMLGLSVVTIRAALI